MTSRDTSSAAPSGTASATSPVPLSANGLHRLALEAFRVGNRGKLSLCEAFRVLSETRLYYDLGYPSLAAYADAFFQLRRSEAFELVRVARALAELTRLRDAFARGRIGWSALKVITRVATVDSQDDWLDFARKHGVERTLAEARDALRRGRNAPRDASFGLPNLDQKLVLRLSRSDMDKVRTWIEKACATVGEKTGAGEVTVEQALLFLCEQSSTAERKGSNTGAGSTVGRAQIVYQCCPDCRRSRMGTREGFVEVASEEVDRYEGCAEQVVIDGPTPPGLRRKVLGREAGRCGNPRCHHKADHCHHVRFRSRGGKTKLSNEVAVCATCHALIHAGLLRVSGSPNGDLRWLPVVSERSPGHSADGRAADELPILHLANQTSPGQEGVTETAVESEFAESSAPALDLNALVLGLKRLGVSATRSRKMIQAAIASLPRAQLTETNVLRQAVASI